MKRTTSRPLRVTIIGKGESFSEELLSIDSQELQADFIQGPLEDSLRQIVEDSPDLVFIDMDSLEEKERQMMYLKGFLGDRDIPFILTSEIYTNPGKLHTSLKTIQFITKPFDSDSLKRAISQALKRDVFVEYEPIHDDRIRLRVSRDKHEVIPIKDIIWVQADNKYIKIKYKEGEEPLMTQYSLSQFYKDKLSHYKEFFPLGRGYIINLNHVEALKNNDTLLVDGKEIRIPLKVKDDVKSRFLSHLAERSALANQHNPFDITFEVPEGFGEKEAEDYILETIKRLDDYYRSMGGSGLKIDSASVKKLVERLELV